VIDRASTKVAWVSLKPVTGRQHQLRAHMDLLGTPIIGDQKYGGDAEMPVDGIEAKLHLHATRLVFDDPRLGRVDVSAPLPDHIKRSFALLGFDSGRYQERG
jgi:23S rRNA pseudouridine955/2504/2580 synthase